MHSCGLNTNLIAAKNQRTSTILKIARAASVNDLRFLHTLDPNQIAQDSNPWENILTSATFTMNRTARYATNAASDQLVFGRDMILRAASVVNWEKMNFHKQKRSTVSEC